MQDRDGAPVVIVALLTKYHMTTTALAMSKAGSALAWVKLAGCRFMCDDMSSESVA